jgi:Nif-specific regulatory protein
MRSALSQNEVSTLCTALLANIDHESFFARLSGFFYEQLGEHKVQIYQVQGDGATRLIAENGKVVSDAPILAKGIGLSGYVTRMKRAYYSNNVKRDPIAANSKREDCVESELSVPLISDGGVVGSIHIQSVRKEQQFNEADIASIQNTINELKQPLRNMHLLMMAQQLNKELQTRLERQGEVGSQIIRQEIRTGAQSDERINLVGISKSFLDMTQLARKLALQDFPVLVEGAHGAGKKMLARKIHFLSPRKDQPCVLVHCTSMTEMALDIELFGKKGKKGALVQANGGSIILDDIGSMPLNIQAKVLRAVVTGEVISVDQEEKAKINTRIIATSKENLLAKVQAGTFKEELFYRLNTMNIKVPSLRDRKEDVKVIAEHFLNSGKAQNESKILTSGALAKLNEYHWPGNIQELRNLMERMAIIVEGQYIDDSQLPELPKLKTEEVKLEVVKFQEIALFDLEKKHIVDTLDHLNGNKTRAAKSLGITVKTLYNKLHSYGLIETKAE